MGNKGGFALLGTLFILAVLCHTGYGLTCYNCIAVGGGCNKTATCTYPLDSCLHVKATSRHYYFCWKMAECNYQHISKTIGEPELEYRCCEKDLCNSAAAVTFPGKTVLLVATLLTIAWNLCL